MAQLGSIWRVLFWPARTFQELLDHPRAALALLLILGAALAAQTLTSARWDEGAMIRATAQKMIRGPGASAGEGAGGGENEKAKDISESDLKSKATQSMNLRRILGYALVSLGGLFGLTLLAFGFWLVSRWSDRAIPYQRAFSLTVHAGLPWAVRSLMAIPVILSYESVDPQGSVRLFKTDLGALFGLKEGIFGFSLADPFWIWVGVLVALAGRVVGWKGWVAGAYGVLVWGLLSFGMRYLAG